MRSGIGEGVVHMYMKLKNGHSKVFTLSYDDGVKQDILNKHGLKGTFNINTGLYAPEEHDRTRDEWRMKLSESQQVYGNSGHEVAVHGLTHPFLERINTPDVLREILEDRRNIESQYGTLARGMAYPFGTYNQEVVDCLEKCGICYARTVQSTHTFAFPDNWLTLHPTCHHNDNRLMELADRFVHTSPNFQDNWLFYVWGHSFEFDTHNNWNVIEEFAEYIGNREDVWYATNIEIYDYVKAYKSLQTNVDETMVYNPTATHVWFAKDGKTYCIKSGERLLL